MEANVRPYEVQCVSLIKKQATGAASHRRVAWLLHRLSYENASSLVLLGKVPLCAARLPVHYKLA